MLPKHMTFEYIYSTQQRIVQSNHKYLTLHKYSTFVPKYLRLTRQNKLQPKFKETQACSGTPLFGRPPRRFLVDTDIIFHQYNLPLRPSQEHQEDSVASRTSPTRVHVLHTVGWLWRRTFRNFQVLYKASPPNCVVRLHSLPGSPQFLPLLEQHPSLASALRALVTLSPGILTRS